MYEITITAPDGDTATVGVTKAALEVLVEATKQGLQEVSPYVHGPVLADARRVIEGFERVS